MTDIMGSEVGPALASDGVAVVHSIDVPARAATAATATDALETVWFDDLPSFFVNFARHVRGASQVDEVSSVARSANFDLLDDTGTEPRAVSFPPLGKTTCFTVMHGDISHAEPEKLAFVDECTLLGVAGISDGFRPSSNPRLNHSGGMVGVQQTSAGRYAMTVHRSSYDTLNEAYARIEAVCAESLFTPVPSRALEFFLSGDPKVRGAFVVCVPVVGRNVQIVTTFDDVDGDPDVRFIPSLRVGYSRYFMAATEFAPLTFVAVDANRRYFEVNGFTKRYIRFGTTGCSGCVTVFNGEVDLSDPSKRAFVDESWILGLPDEDVSLPYPRHESHPGINGEMQGVQDTTAGYYAVALHRGPYNDVGETYKRIGAYLERESLVGAPFNAIEYCLTDLPTNCGAIVVCVPVEGRSKLARDGRNARQ